MEQQLWAWSDAAPPTSSPSLLCLSFFPHPQDPSPIPQPRHNLSRAHVLMFLPDALHHPSQIPSTLFLFFSNRIQL
ncbi:hypothetical protein ACE6H2_023802 [Prunus campanulata]